MSPDILEVPRRAECFSKTEHLYVKYVLDSVSGAPNLSLLAYRSVVNNLESLT